MAKPVVKLNLQGINAVLREAQPFLDEQGEAIAARAGEGFEYVAKPHRWTARGYVRATGRAGMKREARDKVLSRAVHGG